MLISIKMKRKIIEEIEIPSEISCEFVDSTLKCRKDSNELSRKADIPGIKVKVKDNKIIFECERGNKKEFKIIKSYLAHLKNMFLGLQQSFVYKLEACNVHFPMTLKVEKEKLVIGNFLGEKIPRFAKILPGVNIEVNGQKIMVSSRDKEAAGQTAANFEKATRIKNRDRRVFQDGIFLVERPRGAK